MYISEEKAAPLTADYRANGDGNHFKIGGTVIRGFAFTREELFSLAQEDTSKHIFLMLALSYETSSPSTKFLALIAGGISDSNNSVIMTNLQIGRVALTPIFNKSLDKSKFIEIDPGGDYPSDICASDHQVFVNNGNTNHLYSESGKKIKGYHLENNDLEALGLRTELTDLNRSDLFILVPVIRSKNLPDPPFTTEYLSMAITRYTNQPVGVIREYCLPCPNACPTNYNYQ